MNAPVVKVENVSFSYGDTPVLKDVSLQVEKGDFLAILGPNGGGKTTLVRILLGLLSPESGNVRILDHSPRKTRRKVGYVPQHTEIPEMFPMTCAETVGTGLLGTRIPRRQRKEHVEAALEKTGVADLSRRRIDRLSGGQVQRVLIARALVAGPEILLFDEPTAGIDPHGTFCLYDMLSGMKESITLLVVSHHLTTLASHINAVACINKTLISARRPVLTEEMLALMFGEHGKSCPMDETLKSLKSLFMPEAG